MGKTVQVRRIALGEGRPKICVPFTGATVDELVEESTLANASPAELVEWRADYFHAAEDSAAVIDAAGRLRIALGDKPLLFTFRTAREGGQKSLPGGGYLRLNLDVLASGLVDMVDIELSAGDEAVGRVIAAARAKKAVVVGSSHEFHRTPTRREIVARLEKMRSLGVDVPKIAVMPHTFFDVLTLLAAAAEFSQKADCPLIAMSMSRLGGLSRIAGEFTGSCLSFGVLKKASAPGQMSAADLAAVLDILHTPA